MIKNLNDFDAVAVGVVADDRHLFLVELEWEDLRHASD